MMGKQIEQGEIYLPLLVVFTAIMIKMHLKASLRFSTELLA